MSYLPGKFVWFEVMTHDIVKSKAFYTELFGWGIEEMTMQNDSVYTAFKNGDTPIGGFFQLDESMKDVPAHWLAYLSVEDVDASAKKLEEAGGMIAVEPMSMPGVGRMALVVDPEGARFSLFKGENPDPPDKEKMEPGDICWNELWSNLADAALKFYTEAIGYEPEVFPTEGENTYQVLKSGGKERAGLMQSPNPGAPSNWLQYVMVKDCDATVERARALGGQVPSEPVDLQGVGRFTVVQDPDGAAIGILQPSD